MLPPGGYSVRVSSAPTTTYVPSSIPQLVPTTSIWAPPPQPPLIQEGNFYLGGNQDFITKPSMPYGLPFYTTTPPPQEDISCYMISILLETN